MSTTPASHLGRPGTTAASRGIPQTDGGPRRGARARPGRTTTATLRSGGNHPSALPAGRTRTGAPRTQPPAPGRVSALNRSRRSPDAPAASASTYPGFHPPAPPGTQGCVRRRTTRVPAVARPLGCERARGSQPGLVRAERSMRSPPAGPEPALGYLKSSGKRTAAAMPGAGGSGEGRAAGATAVPIGSAAHPPRASRAPPVPPLALAQRGAGARRYPPVQVG